MNPSLLKEALERCRAPADIHDETQDQVGQVEATVEPVGERGEVAVGLVGISKGLVGAREHGLDISQDRIDPLELRQITRLALAHDFDPVSAPGIGDRGEARQAVAEYVGADSQAGAGTRGYRLAGEAWHRRELDKARAALVIERDCCNEGTLFSEPRPALPPESSPPRQASSICTVPDSRCWSRASPWPS